MKYSVKFALTFETVTTLSDEDITYYKDKFGDDYLSKGIKDIIDDIGIPEFTKGMVDDNNTIPEYIIGSQDILNINPKMESIECTVPEWSMSYIFNGDHSGITDSEKNLVDSFIDGFTKGGNFQTVENSEPYFSHSNDIDNIAGNVIDIIYYYEE